MRAMFRPRDGYYTTDLQVCQAPPAKNFQSIQTLAIWTLDAGGDPSRKKSDITYYVITSDTVRYIWYKEPGTPGPADVGVGLQVGNRTPRKRNRLFSYGRRIRLILLPPPPTLARSGAGEIPVPVQLPRSLLRRWGCTNNPHYPIAAE
jgi:hypothetical protein